MPRICALAAIESAKVPLLSAALKGAGEPALAVVASLDVADLFKLSPDLLVADLDLLRTDRLELLRRVRFVLPECILAVYTGTTTGSWGRECHLAGANCLLAKESDEALLTLGLRMALKSGCYTDPRFAA